MDVVDVLNEVGNNFAISSDGIATALQDSASSLMAANNSYEEAVALIASANRVVQDPNSVGAALRTISLRLRGTSTKELEEAGEDTTGVVESKSKLRTKIQGYTGIDILTDTGVYKSTYEILLEISKVWDDLTDQDRAGLLELIAGKTRSNTAAAILSNTKDLEEAYKSAMEAEGSALEENEKYLDSIQGRIDLFNNSVQTMWNNALSSKVVKGIVDLGTKLIKFIDKLGLIPSILGGVFVYFTAFKKQNPFDWIKNIGEYLSVFRGKGGIKQLLGQLLGIAPAMKVVTAETIANTIATQTNDAAKTKAIMTSMGLTGATGTLSVAQKKQAADAIVAAVNSQQLSVAQGQAALATLGFSAAVNVADGSIKAVDATTKSFMASNPIGWILLIVSAIIAVVMWISNWDSKTEKLKNRLKDLNSEISELKGEIDSLNSELERTRDRIAELEALPSLSFVEQEELKNLQLQSAELERQLELQEAILKGKEKDRIETAKTAVDKTFLNESYGKDDYSINTRGVISRDGFWKNGKSGYEALESAIPEYEIQKNLVDTYAKIYTRAQEELANSGELSDQSFIDIYRAINPNLEYSDEDMLAFAKDEGSKYLLEEFELDYSIEKDTLDDIYDGVDMVFGDMQKIISDNELSYTMGDKNINSFLDKYFTLRYQWENAQGGYANSKAVASLFDTTSTEELQNLGKELREIADDKILPDADKETRIRQRITDALNSNSDAYERLKITRDQLDIDEQDIADYFLLETGVFDSTTIEGISNQYAEAVNVMKELKNMGSDNVFTIGDVSFNWDDFFTKDDEGKFTARADKFSEILKGIDKNTSETFMSLAEKVKNNENFSWDDAIKSLNLSGLIAASKILEEQFSELNKSVFKGLEDDISGFIDTFSELGSALEDVAGSMDLLHTAQQQMNSSGQISIKTALELIESTDQWNKVITISNGKVTLNAEAEDVLVQSKLNVIKANIDEALTSAQLQLAQLGTADSTLYSATASDITTEAYGIYTEAMNNYSASIAGFGAAIGALMEGNFFGITDAFRNAYNATKTIKTTEATQSAAELKERIAQLQTQRDLLEQIDTTEEFKNNYDFDKTPGDKYKDDAKSDRFQKEMDYWENRIAANQARYEQIQNEIDLLESQGKIAGEEYYQEQIKLENERLWLLEQQKAAAKSYLGTVKEGSDEWWEAAGIINDLEGEIDGVTSSIQDLSDAMAEVDWTVFEEVTERFSNLHDELSDIRDILSNEDMFTDEGEWTEAGVATLGSYIQDIEIYKNELANIDKQLADFGKGYAGNEAFFKAEYGIDSEQEYYDRYNELNEKQHEYIKGIAESEQSVVEMYESNIDAIEEYTDKLVESYNEYIDSVKEALDAERDLYEFKKNVQKQTKDIAELERRISALSGSDNAADIAERRKLEAELAEAKEGLDDTYYDHAKDAQSQALDDEAEAYEESMANYIEGLRTTLEQAKLDMDTFISTVTTLVTTNASTIETKYNETGLNISTYLTDPWKKAAEAMSGYETDSLALMNQWTTEEGYFGKFKTNATSQLTSPWAAGTNALASFQNSVKTGMEDVVSKVKSNVATATSQLSNLYKKIEDTEKRAQTAQTTVETIVRNTSSSVEATATVQANGKTFSQTATITGTKDTNKAKQKAFSALQSEVISYMSNTHMSTDEAVSKWDKMWGKKVKYSNVKAYAKGTLGTAHDELALTDESWIGEEITLAAGKNGQLQYLKKGSAVMPADISANLVEWGKLNPDMMKVGGGTNLNMISNAINKPEFKLTFDALVKAEKITEDTLPEVKRFVQTEINKLVKQMNYAIKGVGSR